MHLVALCTIHSNQRFNVFGNRWPRRHQKHVKSMTSSALIQRSVRIDTNIQESRFDTRNIIVGTNKITNSSSI